MSGMGIVGSVDWYVGVPLTLLGPEGYLGLGTTSYHINIKKTLIFEKIFKKKKPLVVRVYLFVSLLLKLQLLLMIYLVRIGYGIFTKVRI